MRGGVGAVALIDCGYVSSPRLCVGPSRGPSGFRALLIEASGGGSEEG